MTKDYPKGDALSVYVAEPATPEQRTEVYRRAADILDRDGWTAGADRGLNAEYCMASAVNHAAGRRLGAPSHDLFLTLAGWLVDNRRDQVIAAHRHLGYSTGDEALDSVLRKEFAVEAQAVPGVITRPVRVITRWNDDRDPGNGLRWLRTRDSVTAVLREVAAGVNES